MEMEQATPPGLYAGVVDFDRARYADSASGDFLLGVPWGGGLHGGSRPAAKARSALVALLEPAASDDPPLAAHRDRSCAESIGRTSSGSAFNEVREVASCSRPAFRP